MALYAPSLITTLKRLFGALLSRDRAAYLGMAMIAVGPIARRLGGIQQIIDPSEELDVTTPLPPCLLLISPPRSGSTLIYQVLTRTIPCVYFSNLHLLNPRGATAKLLKKAQLGQARGFKNYYGYSRYLNDVHEGNELMAALFEEDPSPELLRRRFFALVRAMDASVDRPLIIKNVRFHPRAAELAAAVPDLQVVRIQRDTEQVIQSVVRAYHELGTFHPVPPALEHMDIQSPVEFACRMVCEIEAKLDEQFAAIPADRQTVIKYETFCVDPWSEIERIAGAHLGLKPEALQRDGLHEALRASMTQKVSDQEYAEITHFLH